MTVKCPQCDFKNPDDTFYCGKCATPLKPSKEVSITKTLHTPLASPGKTIAGKYKILSEIGRGGMGVVYKAKDTKLKRNVALKFLPSELTKDKASKKRFIQEAQAAAALNHPQICTIYEVDEAEDQTFIAMEYIEGQSLKDKLKDGPLDIDDAKDFAIQVAEGLKDAHEKGIVHRDIKPANIMLTKKGQAKITDFGLAKLSWRVDLTKTSTIMGTVAYMSPEQAKGDEVDHRTDIWSLAAMLYEMLSGERPFKKDKEHALIYSILNDEPKALAEIRSDIPSNIEEAIHKALEKDTSKRYQRIQELIKDLIQSAPISFPKVEKSIVVLPFENLSPDPEQEYFCDGMTEEIISDLSKIQSLRVISRTSAMMLKGTRKSMKTIGRELDVEFVLEGSVRKAGNNLRITAQLIEATSDAHLWAEKYKGTLDDVFDIQEKVSQSIVDKLRIKLSAGEKEEILKKPIKDIQALEIYFKVHKEIWDISEKSLNHALEYLEKGSAIIGDNELLLYEEGTVYFHFVGMNIKPPHTFKYWLQKGEECANKIFKLNPESALGHLLMFQIAAQRGGLKKSYPYIKKSFELDPNNPTTLMFLGYVYSIAGKTDLARPLFVKAREVDPLTPISFCCEGYADVYEGDFEAAIKHWIHLHESDTSNRFFRFYYAYHLALAQRIEEACSFITWKEPETVTDTLGLFLKYALQGKKKESLELITPEVEEAAKWDDIWSLNMMEFHSLIDKKDKACDWLENTIRYGIINYPFLNEYNPFLDNIRGVPRFKKLMERVKHEWENFEV